MTRLPPLTQVEKMKNFLAQIDAVSIWSGNIVSVINPLVVIFVVYEIILRFVFNAPTLWANDAVVYLCAISYLMGGAYSLYYRAHVSVDIIYLRLSERTQAILNLITFFFVLIYLGALVWVGAGYALESVKIRETTGTPWNPPVYPLKIAIPVGAFLMLLQSAANFIRDFHLAIKGRKL